ncbi:MAG: bifunctional glutamate N-acetyltransferase/amino-acid acetyltransferase ArgJ [Cellvibrionaceae bacterium]|nr:bifunctional glutamate N-acetyltransferase/amino-acid acetyltransferase ArgJ [Cellvibrionaceae bacterium]
MMVTVWNRSQVRILDDKPTIALCDSQGECRAVQGVLSAMPDVFSSIALHAGVADDPGLLDFSVVKLDKPCTAAAVYTRSLCASPAVMLSRHNTQQGLIQLICVVSKNAAVFAQNAQEDVAAIVTALAKEFAVDRQHILISCTGIIGKPLPLPSVLRHIPGLSQKLRRDRSAIASVTQAIMTTDKRPKVASLQVDTMRVAGYAKGAGMIEPNMATMLGYIYTNVALPKTALDASLSRAVAKTFNAISVDSDTSTSDTVALISSGDVPCEDLALFDDMLAAVCLDLAVKIAREAEGANTLIEVKVSLATTVEDATFFAKKIVNSPLVKTAIHGGDPNWGRIVMAIGKPLAGSPLIAIDANEVEISIQGRALYRRGKSLAGDAELAALSDTIKQADRVRIEVIIGQPNYSATVWGCDLSADYVRENADYSS